MKKISRRDVLAGVMAAAPFRFALIGDRTGRAQGDIYQRVWAEVAASKPGFVVSIGDTIEGLNDATVEAEWDAIEQSTLKMYKTFPFYHVAGNHDVWNERSERVYEKRTGRPVRYSFARGGAGFVMLDNSRSDALSDSEIAFCDRELARLGAVKPKFVFLHRPSWLIPVRLGMGAHPFVRLMEKHRVDYVFSGHVHQFMSLERAGVRYVMIGSSGGAMDRGVSGGFREGWFYHWLDIEVAGEVVKVSVQELAGRRTALEEWGPNGYAGRR